jgi:hypothetical protein
VQDNTQEGIVDVDLATVLDEAQFPEFIHEKIDPRPRCANHLRQHLLRYFGKHLLRTAGRAITREQQKRAREPFLAGVKELVDQVLLDSDVPRKHISDEAVGEPSGGNPQSALVGIAVTPELEIIFDTVRSSRKFQNLTSNSGCSFVVGWTGEITVQYEGQAHQPEGAAFAHYQEVYFANWPDGPSRLSWPGITYFVVQPRWIRYSDFDMNPKLIQEFTCDGATI